MEIAGLQVVNQPFVLVEKDEDFDGMKADGLLGLGFKGLSDDYPTLIDSLQSQGLISQRVFSIYLSDDGFGEYNETKPASIILGGYDLKTYANKVSESKIVYLGINTSIGYWATQLNGVKVDSIPVSFGGEFAIFDTGSSLLLGPTDKVKYLFSFMQTKGSCFEIFGLLVCDCQAQYPSIEFTLQGNSFILDQSQYFYPIEGYCLFLVADIPVDFWILGDVFLRNYYAIYDMDNSRIGLVDIKEAYNSSEEETSVNAGMIIGVIVVVLLVALASYFILDKLRIKDEPEKPTYTGMN